MSDLKWRSLSVRVRDDLYIALDKYRLRIGEGSVSGVIRIVLRDRMQKEGMWPLSGSDMVPPPEPPASLPESGKTAAEEFITEGEKRDLDKKWPAEGGK